MRVDETYDTSVSSPTTMPRPRLTVLLVFVLMQFFVVALWAQPSPVRVLVPVFSGGPGAYGSKWETHLTILNNSDDPFTSVPILYARDCPIPEGCLVTYLLPARSSVTFEATWNLWTTGFFINFPPHEFSRAAVSLRIFDRSSGSLDHGTEIPVVTEAAFRETELHLLDVPADARFRVTVRIYGLPKTVPTVVMQIFRETPATGAPHRTSIRVFERELTLQAEPSEGALGDLPSSAIVSDPLSGITPVAEGSVYRIALKTQRAGAPIWAFATVTNNESQRVTIISPQLP